MEKTQLTPGQKKFLDFILEYTQKHGYRPSQREIAKGLGFNSVGTVQRYKVKLEELGYLSSNEKGRGLEVNLPAKTAEAHTLPLVGTVAAGRPIEATEQREEVEIPKFMLRSGEHFVLRVSGNSMIEDCIADGDYVVIRKQADANNGETVVALIDNGATIKRFQKRKGRIELHPANSSMKPIVVSQDSEFKIEGILVGVLRSVHA